MWLRNLLFLTLCGLAIASLAAALSPALKPWERREVRQDLAEPDDFRATVERVDAEFRRQWAEHQLTPAPRADDLTIARRLSLGLTGAIPSLEEIRHIETLPESARVDEYLAVVLNDPRHHAYLAERMARAYVGVKTGAFIIYRRGRFVSWLAEQLAQRRPYDALVRDLITAESLGTDRPEANFIIGSIRPGEGSNNQPTPSEIAARISRAMLGVRIDCAECHDHPFEPWKQQDFHGLAAFFGGTQFSFRGLRDLPADYTVLNQKTGNDQTFAPRVPYQPELLPDLSSKSGGDLRQQLAHWVTDPRNERFAQAMVNRLWALMFGRALVEPVDDIRAGVEAPAALKLLADDFRTHGYDLRRLIRLIAATEVFQLDSRLDESESSVQSPTEHLHAWAIYPLTRLRPDQVVGSLEQAASLTTLDQENNLLLRIVQTVEQNAFVRQYGDAGEEELQDAGGTIPQRLLMMNGNLLRNKNKADPLGIFFRTVVQVAQLAPTDARAIEVTYLAVLTRHPTAEEERHFLERFAGARGNRRFQRLEDLCWTLLNSTEFAWNH